MPHKKAGKYANKPKSGSLTTKNFDPKNTSVAGSGGQKVSKMYKPAAPSKAPSASAHKMK